MHYIFSLLLTTLVLTPLAAQSPSALEANPANWVDLLPPESFEGWTRVPVPPIAELRERTQWKVDSSNRYVICAGDGGHEWLRYDRELGDAIFHVEWRFTPREGNPRYNSGVYMRSSLYGEIWHQAQTGQGGGFLFANTLVDGVLKRVNLRNQMKENRVKPAGEWNTYEIRTEGDKISLWVNGATVNELARCAFLKGYLGLEAEGYEITFRNMKLKELR